jgi:hypothetical protein
MIRLTKIDETNGPEEIYLNHEKINFLLEWNSTSGKRTAIYLENETIIHVLESKEYINHYVDAEIRIKHRSFIVVNMKWRDHPISMFWLDELDHLEVIGSGRNARGFIYLINGRVIETNENCIKLARHINTELKNLETKSQ